MEDYWKVFEYISADAMMASQLAGIMDPFRGETAELGIRAIFDSVIGGFRSLLPGDKFRWPIMEKAVQWILGKGVVSAQDLQTLDRENRQKVFSVAGINSPETVQEVREIVSRSVSENLSLPEFRQELRQVVSLAKNHEETIYRTNTKQAYLQGFDSTLAKPRVSAALPYVRYNATPDRRVRRHHWALDGWIAEVNSPLYRLFLMAQKQFNCRCGLTALRRVPDGKRVSQLSEVPLDVFQEIIA